eukprot:6550944-Prymnesium_polylepis.1
MHTGVASGFCPYPEVTAIYAGTRAINDGLHAAGLHTLSVGFTACLTHVHWLLRSTPHESRVKEHLCIPGLQDKEHVVYACHFFHVTCGGDAYPTKRFPA